MFELFTNAKSHANKVALCDPGGEYTYRELLESASGLAAHLVHDLGLNKEEPVAVLTEASSQYVKAQWAVWKCGGIFVPLGIHHPPAEWEHILRDTACKYVITSPDLAPKILPLAIKLQINLVDCHAENSLREGFPKLSPAQKAMIIYTSGTTSKPKGVVSTFGNIEAQMSALCSAWEWTDKDRILNVLPLHHVHGIVNIVSCALRSGARCDMMPAFNPEKVWDVFRKDKLTLFMAVPTIYSKLISHYESLSEKSQSECRKSFKNMRLMVSGSAALPVSVLEKWRSISEMTLLERYGMTEAGMILSNSYRGERIPGAVGKPLPGVQVSIQKDESIKEHSAGEEGELLIKGPSVFLEYWNKSTATLNAFEKGWFKTGDRVSVDENGVYRILGRNSIDIIKSGGYKISALQIEEVLRMHPDVRDCAVIGLADEEWGQLIAAVIIPEGEALPEKEELKEFVRKRLASYKIPRNIIFRDQLPRNALGKVMKPELSTLFRDE